MAKINFNIKYRPEIESGKYKVVTSTNKPARIICWDRVANDGQFKDLKLCVLINDEICGESCYYYHLSGKPWLGNRDGDLFIMTDQPELTEFEQELIKIMKEEGSPIGADTSKYTEGDIAAMHSYSERLLALARKQLQPEIDAEIDKAYKNADAVQYERGKANALKELYSGKEDFKEAVSEKIRNMVSRVFTSDGNATSKAFADEFAWELLALAKAEAYKDLPRWQHMYSGAGGNGEGRNTFLIRDGLDTYRLSPIIVAGNTYLVLHELNKLPKV